MLWSWSVHAQHFLEAHPQRSTDPEGYPYASPEALQAYLKSIGRANAHVMVEFQQEVAGLTYLDGVEPEPEDWISWGIVLPTPESALLTNPWVHIVRYGAAVPSSYLLYPDGHVDEAGMPGEDHQVADHPKVLLERVLFREEMQVQRQTVSVVNTLGLDVTVPQNNSAFQERFHQLAELLGYQAVPETHDGMGGYWQRGKDWMGYEVNAWARPVGFHYQVCTAQRAEAGQAQAFLGL